MTLHRNFRPHRCLPAVESGVAKSSRRPSSSTVGQSCEFALYCIFAILVSSFLGGPSPPACPSYRCSASISVTVVTPRCDGGHAVPQLQLTHSGNPKREERDPIGKTVLNSSGAECPPPRAGSYCLFSREWLALGKLPWQPRRRQSSAARGRQSSF